MKEKTIKVHEVVARFEVAEYELTSLESNWPGDGNSYARELKKGVGHVLAGLVRYRLSDPFDSGGEAVVEVDGEPVP